MKQHFKVILMSGAMALLGACASTATGISRSSLSTAIPSQSLQQDVPVGTVLAVVRYPAFVDVDASEEFYKAFGKSPIGGALKSYNAADPELQAIADSMILKSNYFALSLFQQLAAKLPEHSVLLSPHTIKLDADGNLTSEPMTQAESLANVVSVDFSAYSFPDSKKMMESEPLTFGDLITPLVSVHTDHRAAVGTQGLRLASAPILNRAAGNGQDRVEASLAVLQEGQFEPVIRELDFVAHLKKDPSVIVKKQRLNQIELGAVQSYPLEKITLSSKDIAWLEDDAKGALTDPLKSAFTEGFANQIISIINQTDISKATMAGRAAAISQFDDSLAALTLVGREEADYQSRLRYAERLLEAEQKYLSVQSLRLFDGIQNGEIGAQVRDMLVAEYDILEKRRELARQQNMSTALAIVGAMAATGAIASGAGNGSYIESLALDALITGALFAGRNAFSTSNRSKSVGENYLSSIIPALEEQTSIQVSLIDSNETITAIRFEDLSAKLQTLYSDSQRSLDTIATRCGYLHDGHSKQGTWLGVCENGLANGSGVGVLRNADGTSFEYYGYAQNGQPHGKGYLISHSPKGSQSMEGSFIAGLPDGIIRLTQPGENGKLRRFESGQDIGSAPAGSVVPTPFQPAIEKTASLWVN